MITTQKRTGPTAKEIREYLTAKGLYVPCKIRSQYFRDGLSLDEIERRAKIYVGNATK